MLGEDQLGDLELGEGAIVVLDPGPVSGYESESTPAFRTVKVPGVPRTFVVPASDRYADLNGRVGGFPGSTQLDFMVDWRPWLQGDVIIRSNWTNVLGERVDDAPIIEFAPKLAVPDNLIQETITYGGKPLTRSGTVLSAEVIIEDNSDSDDAVSSLDAAPTTETRVGSGTIRSGVTSIIYRVIGTSPVLLKNAIETARGRVDERTMVLRGESIKPLASFEQDPGATLDYRVDFSSLLQPGELLYGTMDDMLRFRSSPYFALTPGMTMVSRSLLSQSIIVWLRGGVVGRTYSMTMGFNTTLGKTIYAQFFVTIKDK